MSSSSRTWSSMRMSEKGGKNEDMSFFPPSSQPGQSVPPLAAVTSSSASSSTTQWTTEQLMKTHIDRLQDAWSQTSSDLEKQRQMTQYWQEESQRLMQEVAYYQLRDVLATKKLALSQKYHVESDNPYVILDHMSEEILPKLQKGRRRMEMACFVKSGENWIALSSAAHTHEDLIFTNKSFDNFIKFRMTRQLSQSQREEGSSNQALVALEKMLDVLPHVVVEYLMTGHLPEFTAERVVYSSDREGNTKQRKANTNHDGVNDMKGIFVKSQEDEYSRCIFLLYEIDGNDNNTLIDEQNDPQSDELNAENVNLNIFAQRLVNGIVVNTLHPDQLWKDIFQHAEELILASVIHMFEARSHETLVLHSAIKDSLVKQLLSNPESSTNVNVLKEAIHRLEQIIQQEAQKRESYLQEIHEDDDGYQIGVFKVNCDVFFSSFDCIEGQHVPMINANKEVFSFSLKEEANFATFDDAMQCALTLAMTSGKAQLKAFSKLSAQSYGQKNNNLNSRNSISHNINNRATMIEHHIYLAIPMTCSTYSSVFGCVLIQMTSVHELGKDSYQLQHQLSPANGTVSVHQNLIHNLSSAMSQDVGEAIFQYLNELNFGSLSLFGDHSVVQTNGIKAYSEVNMIEAFKVLVEKHRETLHEDEDNEDADISIDSKSSASNSFSGDRIDSNASYVQMIQSLVGLLDSDWVMVFQVTPSAHHNTHHSHSPTMSPTHYHHPQHVSILDNKGKHKVITWTELPSSCRHDLSHILHGKSKQVTTSSNLTIPLPADSEEADLIEDRFQVYHKFQSSTFSEYLPLLDLDSTLVHNIHSIFDDPASSQIHSYSAMILSSESSKLQTFKNPLTHVDTVILFGRLWRGAYLFQPNSELYRSLQQIGKMHRKAMTMIELDHLKSEAFESRQISSIRHQTDAEIDRFANLLDQLQKRILQAKQDQQKAKLSTVAEFRSMFYQSLNTFLNQVYCMNLSVIHDHVKQKHYFQLLKLSKIELIVKEGSFLMDRVQEWILDGQTWVWTAKEPEDERGVDNLRRGRSKSRRHQKKKESRDRNHNINGHVVHQSTEEIEVYSEEENLHNLQSQRGASRVVMCIRFTYDGHMVSDEEGNIHSPPLFIEAMRCCPGEYAWLHAVKWFLTKNVDIIMHCPASQTLEEQRQIASSKVYTNLALSSLSTTMLSSTHFLARTVPQSITKPYHLHDYLHNAKMLHQLCAHYPFNDYIILPITRWNAKINRIHLEDSSDDESSPVAMVEDEFVHLLHLDEESLQDSQLHFLRDQTLSLPTKLSRVVQKIHHYIEQNLDQSDDAAVLTSLEDGGFDSDGTASPGGSLTRKKSPSARRSINLADSWQSWSKGSVISTLPEMGKVLYNYLNDLDVQLDGKLCSLMLGQEFVEFLGNSAEVIRELEQDGDVGLMDYLISTESKVLIYSPFYPDSLEQTSSAEEFQQNRTLRNAWSTHYLLVCRKDRLITPSSFVNVQAKLDEIFAPSQVIATGQPWFECVSGMERLLLAATSADQNGGTFAAEQHEINLLMSPSKRLSSSSTNSHVAIPPSPYNSFMDHTVTLNRGRSILAECMSILKASIGKKYIASVGYLLAPNRERLLGGHLANSRFDIDDDMSTSIGDLPRVQDRIELLRCCSDSQSGTNHRWELGPSTIQCPANSNMIHSRFAKRLHANKQYGGDHRFDHFQYQFQDHHTVGKRNHNDRKRHATHEAAHDAKSSAHNGNTPQIHYIEMTSAQLNELLLENSNSESSNHSKSSFQMKAGTASHGISDAIGATGILLRTDVRVLQIFITSNFNSELGNSEDLVVASLLVYINTEHSEVAKKAKEELLEEQQHNSLRKERAFSRSRSRSPMGRNRVTLAASKAENSISFADQRVPIIDLSTALGRGLMHGIMRVIDITGSLISSLYQRKRAELLYDVKIGEDLATVQSERDYLYQTMEQVSIEVLSSTRWSAEDDPNTWQLQFEQNIIQDISPATKPDVIQSMIERIFDHLNRNSELRNHIDKLQRAHDQVVSKLNQTIVEKDQLFDYLLTFSNTIEAFCGNIGGFSSKADHSNSLKSFQNTKAASSHIDPERLISSLLSTSTLLATFHKAMELLVECGMFTELSQFSQAVAAKLYAYTYQHHHHKSLTEKNHASFHVLCKEIAQLQEHFFHVAEDGNHQSLPEFISTARADYSLIWCTKERKANTTTNASHTSLDLREEVHYTHGAVLVPDKMTQAILLEKVMIAEGSELVYPLPVREPYLQYFASKALVVQKVYYKPIMMSSDHDENSKYCAVIQCIVYEHPSSKSHQEVVVDEDEILSSEGTNYLTMVASSLLRLLHRNLGSDQFLQATNSITPGNVQISSSLWNLLLQQNVAEKETSKTLTMSQNASVALDRVTSNIQQVLLTDAYCRSIAQTIATLLHGTASCAAIADKHDFALILQQIAPNVCKKTDTQQQQKAKKHLLQHHHGRHAEHHSHEHHHSPPQLSGIALQGKALTKLRQIMKEFYASGQQIYVACVEYDFLIPSHATSHDEEGKEDVCYPKWLLLSMVSLEDSEHAHSLGLSHNDHDADVASQRSRGHSEEIVLVMVEIERPPIANDYQMLYFIMDHFLKQPIQHFWQRHCIENQSIELRSLAGSLAITSQSLMQSQNTSVTMIQVWQLLNSINPYFYAKHHVDLTSGVGLKAIEAIPEEEESAKRQHELYLQLQHKYINSFQLIQQWLKDGKELSSILHTIVRCRMMPILSHELLKVKDMVVDPSTQDKHAYNGGEYYEQRFSESKYSSRFFLPVHRASDFLGNGSNSQHSFVYGNSTEGLLTVLGAIALQSYSVVVDDISKSHHHHAYTLLIPISREYDVLRDDIMMKDDMQTLSPDMYLRSRLMEDYFHEDGRPHGEDVRIEAYCSNWVLMIECDDEEHMLALLNLLAPETTTTAEVGHQMPQSTESWTAADANLPLHVLSTLAMNLRQYVLWHRDAIANYVYDHDRLYVDTIMDKVICHMADKVHDIEGFLIRCMDILPVDDSMYRMENVVAVLSHHLLKQDSLPAFNAGNRLSTSCKITRAFVHWCDHSLSVPSYYHNTVWKTCELNHHQMLSIATDPAFIEYFSEEELAMLELSKQHHWEVVTCPLDTEDIARCLGSDKGVALFASNHDQESNSTTILIGSVSSAIPYIVQLEFQLPATPSMPSMLRTILTHSEQLLSSIHQTMDQIILTLFLAQRRHLFTSVTNQKLTFTEQRQKLLSDCMALFTSEGSSPAHVLQKFQLMLSNLPGIHSSTIVCRDTSLQNSSPSRTGASTNAAVTGGRVLYEETMNYHQGQVHPSSQSQVKHDFDVFSPGGASTMLLSPLPTNSTRRSQHSTTAHGFNGLMSPFPSAPRTPHLQMSALQSPAPHSFSFFKTNPETLESHAGRASTAAGNTIANGGASSTTTTHHLHNHHIAEMENIFECHEIQGKLTVVFAQGRQPPQRPASPQRPDSTPVLQTPNSKGNHVKFGSSSSSTSNNAINLADMVYDLEFQQLTEQLLEVITRALVRRVFELHRGAKNKKLMAMKKQELNIKSQELAEMNEQISSLTITNTMTQGELHAIATESERLRLLMASEQKHLKESLQQKKEMNADLRQSMVELKKDSEKKDALLYKQIKELREKCSSLENEREKEKKDREKHINKEVSLTAAKTEMARQLADITKAHHEAEHTIRQLKAEVQALSVREASVTESNDSKLRGMLQKIKILEEELTASRGTNNFLKKQLESANQNLKVAQEEHARQLHALQTTILSQGSQPRSRSNSPTHSTHATHTTTHSAATTSNATPASSGELMQLLKREQQRSQDIQERIHALQDEKNQLR